jgi:hypothetical protein
LFDVTVPIRFLWFAFFSGFAWLVVSAIIFSPSTPRRRL